MPADAMPQGRTAQFARYLLAGGLAALANYGSRFAFSRAVPFELAVVLAFGVGLCTGFLLMRYYAFQPSQQSTGSQLLAYLAVNALALVQTLAISSLLLRLVLPALGVQFQAQAIAHGAGVLVPVVTSYFGHRWLTFR